MDTMHPQYCSRSALRRAPQQTTNSQSGIISQKCRLQGFRVRFGTGPHWKLPGKYVWAKLCRTLVLQKQVLTLLVIEVWSLISLHHWHNHGPKGRDQILQKQSHQVHACFPTAPSHSLSDVFYIISHFTHRVADSSFMQQQERKDPKKP